MSAAMSAAMRDEQAGIDMAYARIPTPVGDVLAAGDGSELWALWIDGQRWAPAIGAGWCENEAPFHETRRQLDDYFAGRRTTFDLPLHFDGTAFQSAVWRTLREIPFGQTRSYGEIAGSMGRPRAARAVGAANGQNPFCIVVPCHRLIGSSRGLVDYAAGVEVKRRLLEHEAAVSGGQVTHRAAGVGEVLDPVGAQAL
jgi:methylated-DNA-[protein]-cysteine S-methyltransferase